MTSDNREGRLDDGLIVLRRARKNQTVMEDGGIRPSSQVFKQGKPDDDVSVYLESETSPERITQNYPDVYVVEVEIGAIRSLDLDVIRDPVEGDPGHCNIVGHKSKGKTRALARMARWTKGHGPD